MSNFVSMLMRSTPLLAFIGFERAGPRVFLALDILAHELADDLRCRLVLRSADLQEPFAQIALYSDAEPRILNHVDSVANGYTLA